MAHILDADIAAFERQKAQFEQHHNGKFVIIQGGDLKGVYDSFDTAAKFAVTTLKGAYLIRQVGASQAMTMPASVAFRPIYAAA